MLVAYAAAHAVAAPSDPELGAIAGQAVEAYAPGVIAFGAGIVGALVTALRKRTKDWIAEV